MQQSTFVQSACNQHLTRIEIPCHNIQTNTQLMGNVMDNFEKKSVFLSKWIFLVKIESLGRIHIFLKFPHVFSSAYMHVQNK